MGFGFSGSGFRISSQGVGFRIQGFGLRVSGFRVFGFRVSCFVFRVSGFGFGVSGFGVMGAGLVRRIQGYIGGVRREGEEAPAFRDKRLDDLAGGGGQVVAPLVAQLDGHCRELRA